jgi:DNA polymerase-3 subunit gamma/tau
MTGTTPPRIHLELMIARLLMELGSEPKQAQSKPAASATPLSEKPAPTEQNNFNRPESTFSADKPAPAPATVATKPEPPRPAADAEPEAEKTTLAELVQVWPEILEDLKSNAAVWVVVNAARPAEINGDVLTLEFGDQLFVDRFKEKPASGNAVFEELREAIIGAIGVRFRFIPRTGPGLRSASNQQAAPAELKAEPSAESATAKANEPAKEAAPPPASEKPAGETEEVPEPTKKMPKLDEEAVGDVVIQGILGGKIVKTIPNTEATKNADESTEMDSPMFNFDAKESE